MAKITIEELFYGDKYNIMGEVVKQVFARQDEFIADPHTFRELEIVRQTLIAVEKMKRNGDRMNEMHSITECDAFSYGFRIGVQLMAEAFLLPIGEDE